MRLTEQLIYFVILIGSYGIGCTNSAEVAHNDRIDHRAELDHVIINEIFNEGVFYETSKIKEEYEWIQTNILKNCKYYRDSNSNITIYVCYWGERLKGLPFYKTICLFDVEAVIKLCFNFNDWKCLKADRLHPCFDSEYIEKIKDCNSYQMLSNYLNYYLDDFRFRKEAEMKVSSNLLVEEIAVVIDSVFENLLYCKRFTQHDSFFINYAFDDIENHFKRDSISCCLQVIHDNRIYLEGLIKSGDDLVYYDAGMHMFWIVSINPKPKKDIFGKQYVTIRPFNYECAYWIYL